MTSPICDDLRVLFQSQCNIPESRMEVASHGSIRSNRHGDSVV